VQRVTSCSVLAEAGLTYQEVALLSNLAVNNVEEAKTLIPTLADVRSWYCVEGALIGTLVCRHVL
jgi:hypothetical protein